MEGTGEGQSASRASMEEPSHPESFARGLGSRVRIKKSGRSGGGGGRRKVGAWKKAGQTSEAGESRVVYLGRIPHGFYEDQMRGFFSQFGVVTRLRLSRNKKTGRSKHYAFVEFETSEVAAIVAESLHNYLVAGHILQARLVPTPKQHPLLWKGANQKFKVLPRQRWAREVHNKERTQAQVQRLVQRQLKREEEKRKKLAAAGIDYTFPSLREKLPKTPVHLKYADSPSD